MRDRMGSGGKGSGIWKLWLKEDERAQFWFAVDGDAAQVPLIHLVPKSGNGKAWTKDVACAKEDADDDTYCALCEDDTVNPSTGKRAISNAYPRLVLLAYVQYIFHPKQNVKADAQWEPIKGPGGTVFKETVNDYRLLIAKPKLQKQIEEAYAGDPTSEDYLTRTPTLLDRPFQLVRSGSGQQVQETLRPGTPAEMPANVAEAVAKAPDLAAIVEAEFSDGMPRTAPRTGSGQAGGYDPEAAGVAAGSFPDEDALEAF